MSKSIKIYTDTLVILLQGKTCIVASLNIHRFVAKFKDVTGYELYYSETQTENLYEIKLTKN